MTHEDMKTFSPAERQALEKELWQTALETVGPREVSAAWAQHLRAWLAMAIARMENEGRVGPPEVALATANLRRFIDLMKTEAVFVGHADRLDRAVFEAVERQLARKGLLSLESLWPFWPNEFYQV
jgi:hypothetical protein